jgi:hypothetical protein
MMTALDIGSANSETPIMKAAVSHLHAVHVRYESSTMLEMQAILTLTTPGSGILIASR